MLNTLAVQEQENVPPAHRDAHPTSRLFPLLLTLDSSPIHLGRPGRMLARHLGITFVATTIFGRLFA
jgi:hypothetical protein